MKIRRSISQQMADARQAYRGMLNLFLNEIVQVDEKTTWKAPEQDWWLDMMRINRLVLECKDNLGAIK